MYNNENRGGEESVKRARGLAYYFTILNSE